MSIHRVKYSKATVLTSFILICRHNHESASWQNMTKRYAVRMTEGTIKTALQGVWSGALMVSLMILPVSLHSKKTALQVRHIL